MKGNLMVRMMTFMILLSIGLAHGFGQVNLWEVNWLWLAIFASAMGLQATFTGFCPSNLVGKLSKTGECCPEGSCGTKSETKKTDSAASKSSCCGSEKDTQQTSNACCGSDKAEKSSSNDCCGLQEGLVIKVLGTGCASCENTVKLIQSVADEKKMAVQIVKVEEVSEIASYGVMSTPAIVINEEVIHSGNIPSKDKIVEWLDGLASS